MKTSSLFILISILATSCASLFEEEKKDCSSTDFINLGQLAVQSGNADTYLAGFQNKCKLPLTPQSLELVNVGIARENLYSCTGYREFNRENWTMLGADVAKRGEKENYYLEFKTKCSLVPSKPQLENYKIGYKDELKSLCTKMGGVEFARKNYTYKSTCPAKSETEFTAGRALGNKFREVDAIQADIKFQNNEISRYEKDNIELESVLDLCRPKLADFNAGKQPSPGFSKCWPTTQDSLRNFMTEQDNKIKNNKLKILDHRRQISDKKDDSEKLYRELEILGKAGAL